MAPAEGVTVVPSIAELLEQRNAYLKGSSGSEAQTLARADLLRLIGDNYRQFEPVRDALLAGYGLRPRQLRDMPDAGRAQVEELLRHGLAEREDDRVRVAGAHGRRFLSGGWLEELAWLAGMHAGADEGVFSQCVRWQVEEYHGENEIDVILRKDKQLAFISCKALQSDFSSANRKLRNRLMDALHEADNLGDHFGRDGDRVGVLVTSDLHDETRGDRPRYQALMGKAAVFGVRIIPLEELEWRLLVPAMRDLVASRKQRK